MNDPLGQSGVKCLGYRSGNQAAFERALKRAMTCKL
jgi:hypothetical protein